jgi:hypothetical protein
VARLKLRSAVRTAASRAAASVAAPHSGLARLLERPVTSARSVPLAISDHSGFLVMGPRLDLLATVRRLGLLAIALR